MRSSHQAGSRQDVLNAAVCGPPIMSPSDDDATEVLQQQASYARSAPPTPAELLSHAVATRKAWLRARGGAVDALPEGEFLRAADEGDALAHATLAVHEAAHNAVHNRTRAATPHSASASAAGAASVARGMTRPVTVDAPLAAISVPHAGVWQARGSEQLHRGFKGVRATPAGRPVDFTPYNREQARLAEEARQKRLQENSDSDC